MTTLRHSSLRPDLPELIKGLLQWNGEIPWHRLMLTTDGPTPPYLRKGFVDYVLRTAMEAGCPPVRAYQMVTLNPACYYRLDEHLGAIAPGRIADINILSSLEEPVPERVVADGEPVAERKFSCAPFLGSTGPDIPLSTGDGRDGSVQNTWKNSPGVQKGKFPFFDCSTR